VLADLTRLVEHEAYRLHDLFAVRVLRQSPAIEQATAAEVRARLGLFEHACQATDDLTDQLTAAYITHPHAGIYASFPGCGPLIGARLLAELGDDPTRFATAKGLRAYAGLAPLTWASGVSSSVTHRRVCNRRLKTSAGQPADHVRRRCPQRPLLGMFPDASYGQQTRMLSSGHSVLLHTDGMLKRGGYDEGIDVLAAGIAGAGGHPSTILDRLDLDAARDDACALLAHRTV
jgi:hypothetical protein